MFFLGHGGHEEIASPEQGQFAAFRVLCTQGRGGRDGGVGHGSDTFVDQSKSGDFLNRGPCRSFACSCPFKQFFDIGLDHAPETVWRMESCMGVLAENNGVIGNEYGQTGEPVGCMKDYPPAGSSEQIWLIQCVDACNEFHLLFTSRYSSGENPSLHSRFGSSSWSSISGGARF